MKRAKTFPRKKLEDYLVPIRTSLCFNCQRACGGCSWSEVDAVTNKIRFEPVAGWTAEKRTMYFEGAMQSCETYYVTACPKYIPDKPRKGTNIGYAWDRAECPQCGKIFTRNNQGQTWCSTECYRAYLHSKNESKKRAAREAKNRSGGRPKGKPTSCKRCKYSTRLTDGWYACYYIGITGKRRPCKSMYEAGKCECFEE